jgi:ribosomal protein S17E
MSTSPRVRYDEDVCAWVDRVAHLIRERKFDELDADDLEHLVDEVEDVGKSESRELANRMAVLLAHLLKWQYQSTYRSVSWETTIKHQRKQVNLALKSTPSLKTRLENSDWIELVWDNALHQAYKETSLPIDTFPEFMSWSFDQVLDPNFLPG